MWAAIPTPTSWQTRRATAASPETESRLRVGHIAHRAYGAVARRAHAKHPLSSTLVGLPLMKQPKLRPWASIHALATLGSSGAGPYSRLANTLAILHAGSKNVSIGAQWPPEVEAHNNNAELKEPRKKKGAREHSTSSGCLKEFCHFPAAKIPRPTPHTHVFILAGCLARTAHWLGRY